MTTANMTNDGATANGAGLKFIIMNTGGKNSGEKPTDRRKQAVFDVITKTKPTLSLLQEFSWTNIRSRGWKDFIWPENLEYVGHADASIIFDVNEVTIEQISQTILDGVLSELDRKMSIRQGFAPIPRMCIRKVKTKGVPVVEFLCISWHGRHNKAKYEDLKVEFKDLMTYVLKLSEKVMLPLVLAGDFNVKLKDVKKYVPSKLVLYEYIPTERREKESMIDFYICSDSLVLNNIEALELKNRTDVQGVLSLFDHDPVEAMLKVKKKSATSDKKTVVVGTKKK